MSSNWFANFVADDSNNNDDNVELQWSNSNSNGIDEEAIVDIPDVDTIDNESANNNNNIAIDNNNNGTRRNNYSIPLSKVVILLLAAFAIFLGIGYGSGYGITEKIWSNRNKAVASVSSANMYQAYGPETEEDCATGKSGKSGPTSPSAGKSGKSGPTSPSEGKSGKSGPTAPSMGKSGKSGPWLEDAAPSATGKSGKSGPTAPSAGKSGKSGSYSPSHGKSGKSGSKCQKPDPGGCVSSPAGSVPVTGACCASEECEDFNKLPPNSGGDGYCAPGESTTEGYCITGSNSESVDCSVTNECNPNDEQSCSIGVCQPLVDFWVDLCTLDTRPSGTCQVSQAVI